MTTIVQQLPTQDPAERLIAALDAAIVELERPGVLFAKAAPVDGRVAHLGVLCRDWLEQSDE